MSDASPDIDRMTLEELQKFLADELSGPESSSDFSRAFTPLTDGLGLSSPVGAVLKPKPIEHVFDTDPIPEAPLTEAEKADELNPTETLAASASLTSLLQDAAPVLPTPRPAPVAPEPEPVLALPPPVPTATLGRRILAGFLDEAFVLALWVISLVITASVMNGELVGSGSALSKEFSQPLFVRFAALEFAVIWLGYLAMSLGVLDMTLGMWAWGMRVKYTTNDGEAWWSRRIARILFSFLFYAPLLPTLLLLPRWKGRNLLDYLSGTALYRVMV